MVILVTWINWRVSVIPRDFPFENRHSGDSLEKMWEKSGDLSWEQEERVGKVSVGPTTARVKQFLWHPPAKLYRKVFFSSANRQKSLNIFLPDFSESRKWVGRSPASCKYSLLSSYEPLCTKQVVMFTMCVLSFKQICIIHDNTQKYSQIFTYSSYKTVVTWMINVFLQGECWKEPALML